MLKNIIYSGLVGVLFLSNAALAKTDSNEDGFFSRDEIIAARMVQTDKKFSAADANKDGRLTLDELSGKKLSVAKAADANKDGVITKTEAQAYVETSVDKRMLGKDLNKDGKLSKDERRRKKVER